LRSHKGAKIAFFSKLIILIAIPPDHGNIRMICMNR